MRLVILGTGTNVGKTYVTSCLARGLAATASVLALKPVESGVEAGVTGDAGEIAMAAGHEAVLSRWRLRRAVSPHLAAREQGLSIRLPEVARWVALEERRVVPDVTLIETAGGAFSPLGLGVTNVELALALEPAIWVLVAPDALGVLHDVTATLRSLPRSPDLVLLSSARGADDSSGGNAAELLRLDICEVTEVLAPGAVSCPATLRWLHAHPTYKSVRK
jgi:dethiobiotin synthetase